MDTKEIRNDASIYLLGALTFALGLAWNEAITSAIDEYFPIDRNAVNAKFLYAVGLTLFIVILGRYIFRKRPKDKYEYVDVDTGKMA